MSDSRELAATGGVELPATADSARMLEMIYRAATDPTVDPQKMTSLADLAIKLQDREREDEFRRAKVAALMECADLRISKRGAILNKNGGVQSRYSKFEDIHRVVTPLFARHGLAISFEVGQAGSLVTVRPILTHVNGYQERGDAMPLAIDTTGSKNATQGAGSAASYGKRHTLKALANLIEEGEDDDGQKAGGGGPQLAPHEKRLADAAAKQAESGAENYAGWFSTLTPAERGWLVYSGRHEALKAQAGEVK
jgi:hypothetical protein